MGFYRGPKIITDDLALYLDAANPKSYPGSGTVWFDLTDYNNNGVLTNGPTLDSESKGVISFDGVDDYVTLGNPDSLNITAGITLSTWVNIPLYNRGVFSDIITKGVSFGGSNASYFISITYEGRIFLEIVNDSNVRRQIVVSAAVAATYDGLWTNFTGTYDGGRLTLYINGVLFSTTLFASSPIRVRTGNVTIGGTRYLDGKVSNAMIYERALTAEEVLQNYNTTKSRFGL